MRTYLSLAICGAIAAPGGAVAQTILSLPSAAGPQAAPSAAPGLAPLPTVAPTDPVPAPITAAPPPIAEPVGPAPELEPPTTVAPVIVAKDNQGRGIGGVVGTTAAGVAGGAAGAAMAGPVGKFAGGFLAKRIAQGIFGKQDKTPELTVIPQTPSAATASAPAAALAAAPKAR